MTSDRYTQAAHMMASVVNGRVAEVFGPRGTGAQGIYNYAAFSLPLAQAAWNRDDKVGIETILGGFNKLFPLANQQADWKMARDNPLAITQAVQTALGVAHLIPMASSVGGRVAGDFLNYWAQWLDRMVYRWANEPMWMNGHAAPQNRKQMELSPYCEMLRKREFGGYAYSNKLTDVLVMLHRIFELHQHDSSNGPWHYVDRAMTELSALIQQRIRFSRIDGALELDGDSHRELDIGSHSPFIDVGHGLCREFFCLPDDGNVRRGLASLCRRLLTDGDTVPDFPDGRRDPDGPGLTGREILWGGAGLLSPWGSDLVPLVDAAWEREVEQSKSREMKWNRTHRDYVRCLYLATTAGVPWRKVE